jgi:hypothetical protein
MREVGLLERERVGRTAVLLMGRWWGGAGAGSSQ